MKLVRQGGLLLHPSSLPGPYGIGSIGKQALAFIDRLVKAKIKVWQILPLGPTGYGDSPYQCFSAFAGNPYLIDLDMLQDLGFLQSEDFPVVSFPDSEVEYGEVIPYKMSLLRKAHDRFFHQDVVAIREPYEEFCIRSSYWLEDYALFMAIKGLNHGKQWLLWPDELKNRTSSVTERMRNQLKDEIHFQKFIQFVFFDQWNRLKQYANKRGVKLLGDMPLYVSLDSSEAWSNPEWFQFDPEKRPLFVAGVPPDYFSETGQLWGNPIYDWDSMEQNGFDWWIRRVKANLELFDMFRIDHFRGLEAYWSVPYGENTAIDGQWNNCPGLKLLKTLHERFGELPIVAEDLGVITPEVIALRNQFGFPGMKILQFAFDSGESNDYLPHGYESNSVVYTGTHDNDTVLGWASTLRDSDRLFLLRYLNSHGEELHWDLIRLAWSSVAALAVVPVQDVIGAGSTARMNLPGSTGGNWKWRLREGELSDILLDRLADLSSIYAR